MQSLFILLVWMLLIGAGFIAPFVLGLAYIWVDLFRPQDVASGIIRSVPVSMLTALLLFAIYFLRDRQSPPRLHLVTTLTLLWAIWITLTTTWAFVPESAWIKWDWAVKTVLFSAFLPFLFRSRIQIEAAILVIVFSILSNSLPFGLKTLFGGGGYGRPLGLVPINAGWGGEGSTLAMYATASIPLLIFLGKHSMILPNRGINRIFYILAPVFSVMGALGTFARSGLIACGILSGFIWWQSKRKIILAAAFTVAGFAIFSFMGDRWTERMATTTQYGQETSAATRLLVWQWTMDFAKSHPLGGGFDVYKINFQRVILDDGSDYVVEGRAFHSLYFEVLGEHGFIGAILFFSLVAAFFIGLFRLARRTKGDPELLWLHDLARAFMISSVTYFAGAAFVGVAFQPLHYYFFSLSVALNQYFLRSMASRPAVLASADKASAPGAGHRLPAETLDGRPDRFGKSISKWRTRSHRQALGTTATPRSAIPSWRNR